MDHPVRRKPTLASATLVLLMLCLFALPIAAEESSSRVTYGPQGWQYDDGTGNNFAWFGVRVQPRASSSRVTQDEMPGDSITGKSETRLNRGRFKLGGNALSSDFKFYTEYDFVGRRLLDFRLTYKFNDFLSLRVGQWKSEYNRERVDSSGKQQFVERSISTPWFTVDRQQGVVASGRLGKGSAFDVSYWTGWISGAGRGGDRDLAEGLWLARAQWNYGGRVLAFSQSALGWPDQPEASIAIATVSGKSGFTSFSSSGGGQLPGFEDGDSDRYRIEQWVFETAYQYRGFSWQQELHMKEIGDRVDGMTTRLVGGYAQAGIFPAAYAEEAPAPLEFAVRYSYVDPDDGVTGDAEREYTFGANWFFSGHRSKLTLDVSHLTQTVNNHQEKSNRIRFQWDWSF